MLLKYSLKITWKRKVYLPQRFYVSFSLLFLCFLVFFFLLFFFVVVLMAESKNFNSCSILKAIKCTTNDKKWKKRIHDKSFPFKKRKTNENQPFNTGWEEYKNKKLFLFFRMGNCNWMLEGNHANTNTRI